MARYMVKADTVLDGLKYERGTVINAPHNLNTVQEHLADLEAIPRLRIADIALTPPYVAVPAGDQLGRKTSTGELAKENVIEEPVLPTANSQYD